MSFPSEMPIVVVDWVDSQMSSGWHDVESMLSSVKDGDLLCRSVGYVFLDADDRLVLIGHQADNGNVGDAMTIPKSAIKTVTTIQEPTP